MEKHVVLYPNLFIGPAARHARFVGPIPVRTPERSASVWSRIGLSLANTNFRRYLLGQSVSHTGMWLQQTAELWLIFEITGSGTALGWHAVLRFGPTVVLGLYGGVISDRLNRRKLLICTQALQMLGAAVLTTSVWRALSR